MPDPERQIEQLARIETLRELNRLMDEALACPNLSEALPLLRRIALLSEELEPNAGT
jgi:hypothetical protein